VPLSVFTITNPAAHPHPRPHHQPVRPRRSDIIARSEPVAQLLAFVLRRKTTRITPRLRERPILLRSM